MFQEYSFDNQFTALNNRTQLQYLTTNELHIEQLQRIQNHTQLIQKIIQKLPRQKECELLALQSTQSDFQPTPMKKSQSMISIYSLSYDLNNFSFCHQDRLKFGSQESKFLHQIKQKCSAQAYQYFSKLIKENRQKQKQRQTKNKDKQQILKLSEQNLIITHQKDLLKIQLTQLQSKLEKSKKDIQKLTQKQKQLMNLQKKLLKKQQGVIYQRKINNNLLKQIKKQMNSLQQLYENIENQKRQLNLQRQTTNQCKIETDLNHNSENEEQNNCQNCCLSKSTIDGINEKPQIIELWSFLSKFQNICLNQSA